MAKTVEQNVQVAANHLAREIATEVAPTIATAYVVVTAGLTASRNTRVNHLEEGMWILRTLFIML